MRRRYEWLFLTVCALLVILGWGCQGEEEEPPLDTIPPAAVTNLAATPSLTALGAVELTWSATGDDGMEGGPAAAYVVRYSETLITEGTWASATLYAQAWVPSAPGTFEVREVDGLNPGTPYFFAMKVLDDVGNASPISNVATEQASADRTPPAAITDLAAVPSATTEGAVTLTWTAVGEDGTSGGPAAAYEFRYATAPITDVNWALASVYPQNWIPLSPGGSETREIGGLTPGTLYHFAAKVLDESANLSPLSNGASATAQTDCIAPAAVTDLGASPSPANGQAVTLTWTATGDDGMGGGAADAYEVRYSLSPITTANWGAATLFMQSWNPLASGQSETHEITGLQSGTRYYFALKVLDEVPNASPLSNVADSMATSDITPPAMVTDLAATANPAVLGSIILTWTAVGDDGMSGGPATTYEVRYSTSPVTSTNWSAATVYPQTWVPSPPGQGERREVRGLTTGTAFYFALQVADEVPNWSGVSNGAWAQTASGWRWENPYPQGNRLTSISGTSATNAMAVGMRGNIIHWDGTAWGGMDFGANAGFEAVWCLSPTEAFAVGGGGTIYRFNGTTWSAMPSGTTEGLYGVWGASGSQVYAVGGTAILQNYTHLILRYDGSAWTPVYSGQGQMLRAVWGASANEIFAVGNYGTILHYNGMGWASMTSGTTQPLYAVWGTSGTDVYAAGFSGTILHYDGNAWSSMYSATTEDIHSLWAASGAGAFAAGKNGTVLRYDGTSWTSMSSGTQRHLLGIWGSSGSDVFAVGGAGPSSGTALLHYDGTAWSSMVAGSTQTLHGVWGSSGTDVFAVGASGTILHNTGNGWGAMSSGTTGELRAVWGSSGSDVFAVGQNGTIVHFDGSAWSPMSSGTSWFLLDVWGTSATDVFAVGISSTPPYSSGGIIHYDGNTWSSQASGQAFYTVWGASSTDVYALGAGGSIHHYDGAAWTAVSSGATTTFYDAWGSSATDIFAVGGQGRVYHYDGFGWTLMNTGSNQIFHGVWGSSATDVYAVGYGGQIYHYTGSVWGPVTRNGMPQYFFGVWGSSGSDVYLVGSDGAIVHFR
jgi:hypothetical protein